MEMKGKGRSRPMPDAGNIKNAAYNLEEALSSENQYICNYNERKSWEVSIPARDRAVHVLKMLKVWFDLPESVFFSSVSYLDLFLIRMKVQEKYLSCVSVSCFNLAATNHGFKINIAQLVTLSQSKCSIKDMERMSSIINQKLGRHLENPNVLDLLKIYLEIFTCIAVQFNTHILLNRMLKIKELCLRLEVLMCDSACISYKSSVLALAFIQSEMERFLTAENPKKSTYSREMFYMLAVMIELRSLCKISTNDYANCIKTVSAVLKDYDNREQVKYRQKSNLRFSQSTHALSKCFRNYYNTLNRIKEEE